MKTIRKRIVLILAIVFLATFICSCSAVVPQGASGYSAPQSHAPQSHAAQSYAAPAASYAPAASAAAAMQAP
ncbi:MAG: hypothetical protein WCP73_08830, partial [Eubacteriales bacterium]